MGWVKTLDRSTENNKDRDNHSGGRGRETATKETAFSQGKKSQANWTPAFYHRFVRLLKCCVEKRRNEKRSEKF